MSERFTKVYRVPLTEQRKSIKNILFWRAQIVSYGRLLRGLEDVRGLREGLLDPLLLLLPLRLPVARRDRPPLDESPVNWLISR